MRVAVIGVGALGKHHARILAELPGAELAGVVDINVARASDLMRRTVSLPASMSTPAWR